MKKKKELDPNAVMIKTLQDGLNSPFWELMRKLILEEKEAIEQQVFEDPELDDKQRNELRNKRNTYQYVLELPELVIEKSTPKPPGKDVDFETYDG